MLTVDLLQNLRSIIRQRYEEITNLTPDLRNKQFASYLARDCKLREDCKDIDYKLLYELARFVTG
jgi:hypothetical protein